MTDYKTQKGVSKSYDERGHKFKKTSKHFISEKEKYLASELESDLVIQKYSQYTKTFSAPIQAIEPSSFAFFGKAEQYYNDSAYSIINYYPFDGTHEETLDWFISATNLDTSLLQQEWPTYAGHVGFSGNEYVSFYAGPQSITQENYKGKVRNQESSLRIDPDKGVTVEFWMKKTNTENVETIFELGTHQSVATTNTDRDRVRLNLKSTAQTDETNTRTSLKLTYTSASFADDTVTQIGVQDLEIGKSAGTGNTNNADWHHYAVKLWQTKTEGAETYTLNTKLYVDGQFDTEKSEVIGAKKINFADNAMAGRLGLSLDKASPASGTPLRSSLDSFRYWKGLRTSREIGRYYDQKVYASDHKEIEYVSRLGVNFTFNESATGDSTRDKLIIDYSGNDVVGTVNNYSAPFRVATSAIDLSTVSTNTEVKDPILFDTHSEVKELKTRLSQIGQSYDLENSNTLNKKVPGWLFNEMYDLGNTGEMDILLHMMASVFDVTMTNLGSLRKLTRPEYTNSRSSFVTNGTQNAFKSTLETLENSDKGGVFNSFSYENKIDFMERLLENYGFSKSEYKFLWDLKTEEVVESIVENIRMERSTQEIRSVLYDCLANAAAFALKRKGTETSYNSILNAIGLGRDVISFNILGQNAELRLKKQSVDHVIKKLKTISFWDNPTANLHQTSTNSEERSYLQAPLDESEFTFEGNFIFPQKKNEDYSITDSSVFGIYEVSGTNNNFTFSDPNRASFQVSVIKDSLSSSDAKFVLSSRHSIIAQQVTDIIPGIYDGSVWNLSIKIYKDTEIGHASNSALTEYKLDFSGYNYISDELRRSFKKTVSITQPQYEGFKAANKTAFIGADRENITGTLYKKADQKVLGFNSWSRALSDDELKKRASHLTTYGVEDPHVYPNVSSRTNLKNPEVLSSLIMKVQLADYTAAKLEATSVIKDETSGSPDLRAFFGNIRGYAYPLIPFGFTEKYDKAISIEHLSSIRNVPLINTQGIDGIDIKNSDMDHYEKDSKPELKIISFEKSMYRAVSNEMLDFISGVNSFNNLIGEPVNKYRQNYKFMDYLKRSFFMGVENENQFERFVTYYRWLDKSIGHFLSFLVPGSTVANTGIENVIESHMLERNKIQYKLPKLEYKDPDEIEAVVLGVEARDNQRESDALRADSDAERGEDQSIHRSAFTSAVVGRGSGLGTNARNYSKFAQQTAYRSYAVSATKISALDLGSNSRSNSIDNYYTSINSGTEIVVLSDNVKKLKETYKTIGDNKKKKFEVWVSTDSDAEYSQGSGDLLLPISFYASDTGNDFPEFKSGLVIGNKLSSHRAVQGMFGTRVNITQPHRNVPIGTPAENRPEAFKITVNSTQMTISQPSGLASVFYKNSEREIFYNITNIKHNASTGVYGNYGKDSEVLFTTGRTANNRHFVKTAGQSAEQVFVKSTHVPQLTDFADPNRDKQEHIIVSKFDGAAMPELSGLYGSDSYSSEYSAYNGMNNRNGMLREVINTLSSEYSQQFGYRPGSSTLPSWHKINRNTRYYHNTASLDPVRDNLFVQNHIPQSDFSYSWINNSAHSTLEDFLKNNMNMGHQHNFNLPGNLESKSLIEFVSSSVADPELDFVGLNYKNLKTFSSNYDTLTNSSNSLNSILLNLNGPSGWSSWKQTRIGQSPLARKQNRENIYSIVFEGNSPFARPKPGSKFDYKRTIETNSVHTTPRTVRNYSEIPVTKRFYPLSYSIQPVEDSEIVNLLSYAQKGYSSQEISSIFWSVDWRPTEAELFDVGMTKIIMKIDAQNNASFFANEKMTEEVNFFNKPILQSDPINKLNMFIRQSKKSEISYGSTPQLNYIEKIYPKEINTFTKKARNRTKFDFFGWKSARSLRSLNLSGNISYGDFSFASVNLAPSKTKVSTELDFEKSYFNEYDIVDLNAFDSSASISSSTHLTQSRWVLDARTDFSALPIEISDSYFNNTSSFLSSRTQGTRGEGILQNDFSLLPLGMNSAFGIPPIAPVYSRRVIQSFGTSSFLAGEAMWQAADNHPIGPWYDSYEEYSEKTKLIGKEYSLVPEFSISRHTKELLTTSDLENTITNISDFLYLTGTEHPSSSNDSATSAEFFRNYSNSDFMKYFLEIQENNAKNNFNLRPDMITMRSKAVKKLLPYRGFYPAERVVQISEAFNDNYLPPSAYSASFFKSSDYATSQAEAETLIEFRIQNSKAQVIRPLLAPGVLMNSIKAGLAVDYPIFSSSMQSALDEIVKVTEDNHFSMFHDLSLLPTGSDLCFTGSELNSSQDPGVPRIKGNVSRRVTFRDLLNPERLYGEVVHDNEPHSSASLLYGSRYHVALAERPALFGELDKDKTKLETGVEFESRQILFTEKLLPYKSAIHNFTAETVNFFLEDGNLTTLVSDAVYPELTQNKKYKMYVYLENTGITMYDRHSAFGPAVDDGAPTLSSYDFHPIVTPGTSPAGSVSFSAYNESITDDETLANGEISLFDDSTKSSGKTYLFNNSGDSDKQTGMTASSDQFIYVQVDGISTLTAAVGQFLAALTGTTGHGTQISASYNASSKLVSLALSATGSTTVLLSGSSEFANGAPDVAVTSFSGGTSETSTTGSFLTVSSSSDTGSHGYLPYVPPYLDPNTSPYAEITFTPPETDRYTIPQIIDGSTIVYYNLPTSVTGTSTNYANSMNIEASLELKNYVALKRDNYTYETDSSQTVVSSTKNPQTLHRWVIHTKWETPILDFSNSKVKALNLSSQAVAEVTDSPWKKRYQSDYYEETADSTVSYLTSSTGMWHQKGEILPPDTTSGYVLGISGPHVSSSESEVQNLAEVLGFTPKDSKSSVKASTTTYGNKRLGNIAKSKDICEAIIAIPYYEDKAGNMQLFQINELELDRARTLNTRQKNRYYLEYINSNKLNKKQKLKEYYSWIDESGMSNTSNCAYQLRMMDKYIVPPQFDFIRNQKINPHVQYVFQFKSTLTQEDLANLWQNLYPESTHGPNVAQHSRISPNKSDILQSIHAESLDKEFSKTSLSAGSNSFYKNPEIFNNEKVRWLVFKSKYRAIKDYSELVRKSISPFEEDIMTISVDESQPLPDSFKNYGFNWPYDYFSLVELADLTVKIDLSESQAAITSETSDTQQSGYDIITTVDNYEEQVEVTTEASSFVNKNFINLQTSGSSLVFRQTLKTDSQAAPSPANQMTISLPDGYSIKSGSESIYLNGVLQMQGSSSDYTLSGKVVSFNYDIDASDGVIMNYVLANDE